MNHDYTVRGWGHEVIITQVRGMIIDAVGWGSGVREGDYLLIPNGDGTTRYQVETITYYPDPSDMWQAELLYAPREERGA